MFYQNEVYVRVRYDELLQEAALDRLAAQVARPRRRFTFQVPHLTRQINTTEQPCCAIPASACCAPA